MKIWKRGAVKLVVAGAKVEVHVDTFKLAGVKPGALGEPEDATVLEDVAVYTFDLAEVARDVSDKARSVLKKMAEKIKGKK